MYWKRFLFMGTTSVLLIILSGCTTATPPAPPTEIPSPTSEENATDYDDIAATMQQAGCGACHVIPGIPNAQGIIGPDLSQIGELAKARIDSDDYTGQAGLPVEYIWESIVEPDVYVVPECPGGPCIEGQMPTNYSTLLDTQEMDSVVEYLLGLTSEVSASETARDAPAQVINTPPITDEEFAAATQIFFNRCAGCHGTLRKGATGPGLTPDQTLVKGTTALQAIIFSGTPRGMPDWGRQGILTQDETEMMARFIQQEPPKPLEMSLQQMRDAWKVIIPVEDRPAAPEHGLDWQNFFAVTLRDAGQVAIIDGETKEIVNTVDTGYAVHISRMSASGRYIFTIGRDGRAVLIDLWLEKPDKVAESRACFDARSIEVSKYQGDVGDYFDKYAIIGCYWPPHFVILDGLTLEPIKVVSTRGYTVDTGEYHPEPRVASIVASRFDPQWIVNVKETGQVWLVDYTDPLNPTIKMIEAEMFLHDGGWDSTGRYFLVAANERNTIVVVDAKEEELVALVETGEVPHPGRGANWIDPEFGPVWSTAHLGEGTLASIGTDPIDNPESAWEVVRSLELPGGGSLFLKTHPNSPWIWIDFALNADEKLQRSVCVIAKENPSETYRCWEAADYGRSVHFEYNKDGDEVWVSIWGQADIPGKTGEIVIYDDKTLTEKARISNLVTPTGKFNVYNTVNEIY